MKNVILLFLILIKTCQSNAQVTSASISLDELKECTFLYQDLTETGGAKYATKVLLYKSKKYSGCAVYPVKDKKGFYAYEIIDGKVEREIYVYPNGKLERDFQFKNGLPFGIHRMWYENGNLYIKEEYKNGKPHRMQRWHNNQQLAREAYFKNGEIIKEVLYSKNGEVIR